MLGHRQRASLGRHPAGFAVMLGCALVAAGCDRLPGSLGGDLLRSPAPLDRGPAFYRYVNDEGRTVYVSDRSMVPGGAEAEPVDVSHVDLNVELGRELEAAVEAEHARLRESEDCVQSREDAAQNLVEHAADRHGAWLGIIGLVLLLVLTAPWVAKRVGAGRWVRVLALVIPLVLFLGVLIQTLTEASSTLAEVRETSDLCAPDRLERAGNASERMGVVSGLRARIERTHRQRQARIDAVFESE